MKAVLLSGAKKNWGDFLIERRLRELIAHDFPSSSIEVIARWESSSEEHFGLLNECDVIFSGGGPWVRNDFFSIFPIFEKWPDFVAKTRFVAGGWKGENGNPKTIRSYLNDTNVRAFLLKASRMHPIGVRDNLTELVLRSAGIDSVSMTGCSAWYDLASIGKDFQFNPSGDIIVSNPQNDLFDEQAFELVRNLILRFPDNNICFCFNRGLLECELTSQNEAYRLQILRKRLKEAGINCLDISASYEAPNCFNNAFFHVGYRVHSHLYSVSKRIPSILINEDGRGIATSSTLGQWGCDAFDYRAHQSRCARWRLFKKLFPFREVRISQNYSTVSSDSVVPIVMSYLDGCLSSEFRGFEFVARRLDRNFSNMRKHLFGVNH